MSPEDLYKKLQAEAQTKCGFTSEDIKRLLKKHGYSSFKAQHYDIYLSVLRSEWIQTDEQQLVEQEEKEKVKEPQQYQPIPCPVCGAPTSGSIRWTGRWTRKPAWVCSVGGIKHYLWARANSILVAQGKKPRDWSEFENARTDCDKAYTEP